ARDRLLDPGRQLREGKKAYDRRLTVAALQTWPLDAELVVFSARETGLARWRTCGWTKAISSRPWAARRVSCGAHRRLQPPSTRPPCSAASRAGRRGGAPGPPARPPAAGGTARGGAAR